MVSAGHGEPRGLRKPRLQPRFSASVFTHRSGRKEPRPFPPRPLWGDAVPEANVDSILGVGTGPIAGRSGSRGACGHCDGLTRRGVLEISDFALWRRQCFWRGLCFGVSAAEEASWLGLHSPTEPPGWPAPEPSVSEREADAQEEACRWMVALPVPAAHRNGRASFLSHRMPVL